MNWLIRKASKPGAVKYDYSCAQAPLPKDIAELSVAWGKDNIDPADLYVDEEDGAKGLEDHPHVTVKYGIHDAKPDAVVELFKDEPPIKIKFKPVSIFENDDKPYDVVKFEIDSEDLHRLNKKISENVEVTDTHPVYNPHATIAYVKKGTGKKYVGYEPFKDLEVVLDKIEFSSKDKKFNTDINLN